MSQDSRLKWDNIYARKSDQGAAQAAGVLEKHQYLLPDCGAALDYASGRGGNALVLARAGLKTVAIDISTVALEQLAEQARGEGLKLETSACDLTSFNLLPSSFEVVVCSYYLDRHKLKTLGAALKPGGLLFLETFNASLPSGSGPSNPDFLLKRGELLSEFSDLHVLFYQEVWGYVDGDGRTGFSRLLAQKADLSAHE